MSQSTLLFDASDVAELLDQRTLLDELRGAMRAYATAKIPARRAHSAIPGRAEHSVMVVFPGLVAGIPAYTVKINAKLPASTPSVRGLIALFELDTGRLLAVMDSIKITEIRTALIGALAADVLARKTITTVAIIGAGVQGRAQLRALRLVRTFDYVRVYDTRAERARTLIDELQMEMDVKMTGASSVADAVKDVDIVITATWSRSPIVTSEMIAPGTHVTAIGADEPGKAELDRGLIQRSRFVCDDADLAVEMGALAGVGLGRDAIHATLGEVLAGIRPGRVAESDITVFGSVGLPCQDLPAAWMAYEKKRERSGQAASFVFSA